MSQESLSPARRSVIGLTALGGLMAALFYVGGALTTADPVETVEDTPRVVLASLSFEPEDFGDTLDAKRVETRLKRNETLSGLMDRIGVEANQGGQALYSLTQPGLLDARKLRPGFEVTAFLTGDTLTALSISPEPGRQMLTKRGHDGTYRSVALESKLTSVPQVIRGTVDTSLYNDARKLGAGDQQVVDFAQVFAFDVDFQREIHPGDEFELVFESMEDERGNVIRRGDVIFASLDGKALTKRYYQFTTPDEGIKDYFDHTGQSATRFLMKTPINGARLSSHFGKRRHPISVYTRLHKGTDFAAPTGTKVYAAGHGVVVRASRYGGYGKYVRIRHDRGYKTAYAHLSRYGPGVRSGKRVRQGDVIGYVGSTGASTGPHLHYEVHKNGRAVNAMRLKLPTGRKLENTPEIQAAFDERRDAIDAIREAGRAPEPILVAEQVPPAL